MQLVAVPALLYDLTDSSTWLGVSSMASLIPAVFLTPYAGVLADRISRRRILLITQVVQMTTAFVLWTMYLTGSIRPGLIVALGLFGGISTGFQTAAWQSFVPLLVPPDEMLDAVKLHRCGDLHQRDHVPVGHRRPLRVAAAADDRPLVGPFGRRNTA